MLVRRQPDLSRRWVVVGAAAVIVGLGMGALFSLSVFLKPMQASMGWSRTQISTVALLNWIAVGVGSFVWGALSDRWGTRAVAVAGGLLLGLGLVVSSQVTTLRQFCLTFGFGVGLAVGAFYAPLTATATKWFVTNRGLAVAVVSAGSGLGMFVVAPLSRWLISLFDWRLAMVLLGDLVWLVIVPMALLVRNAPAEGGPTAASESGLALGTGAVTAAGRIPEPNVSLQEIGRSPQFWLLGLTHFICCTAHSGPIFHMVAHAMDQGIGKMVAATVFGLSGLASIAGRIGSGMIADRLGAKRTLLSFLTLQAVVILLYLFAGDATGFYLLAVVFGIGYGGVMPVYALLTRECFGARAMGGAYGGIFMLQAIGMGIGAFGGGWFYDRLGTYTWLFMTSSAIGLAAILLALTLRPPRAAP
jgi:MFS family permease